MKVLPVKAKGEPVVEVMRMAWPVVEEPVNVLLAKITGEATEAHLLPAVTPVTLIVEPLITVELFVVRVSFSAGTTLMVELVIVDPVASIDLHEENVIRLKVVTFFRVTFALMTDVPEKSQVADALAVAVNSNRHEESDEITEFIILQTSPARASKISPR